MSSLWGGGGGTTCPAAGPPAALGQPCRSSATPTMGTGGGWWLPSLLQQHRDTEAFFFSPLFFSPLTCFGWNNPFMALARQVAQEDEVFAEQGEAADSSDCSAFLIGGHVPGCHQL